MIAWLRHLLGCLVSTFRSRQDLILENLALRQQLLALARPTTSPTIDRSSKALLGAIATSLGRMETTAHPGYTPDRRQLASCRVSAVLEVAFPSPIDGRAKADSSRGSSLDFSDGG